MAITIAISGKGGSGKTTLSALMVRILKEKAKGTVLAVDADPNACLGLTLGVEVEGTIAGIREQVRAKTPDKEGMDRPRMFEYGIQQVITEAQGFDLLTMGRPEGPDCYCAANNLLRKYMDQLSKTYHFVILDNEAGMEHLSRRTTNHVDLLFIAADATPVGEVTATRIFDLTKTLPIDIKRSGVLWNRSDLTKKLNGINILGSVPYDDDLSDASHLGKTVFDLDENNPALVAVQQILEDQLNL